MDERTREPGADLYERDFYSWTQEQARLLRSGQLESLDVANLIEEVETLGRSERASLKSSYRLICSHLLKMKYQPGKHTRSWHDTVDRERGEVADVVSENPGLKSSQDDIFEKAYNLARRDAARETQLPIDTFPQRPPFDRDACESLTYMPRSLHDAGKLDVRRQGKKGEKAD